MHNKNVDSHWRAELLKVQVSDTTKAQ